MIVVYDGVGDFDKWRRCREVVRGREVDVLRLCGEVSSNVMAEATPAVVHIASQSWTKGQVSFALFPEFTHTLDKLPAKLNLVARLGPSSTLVRPTLFLFLLFRKLAPLGAGELHFI